MALTWRALACLPPAPPPGLQEWQVCQVTVGALGDVARAIERDILPYCDRLMLILLHNLQSNDVHRNIKPQILSCFGDLALAVGDSFEVSLGFRGLGLDSLPDQTPDPVLLRGDLALAVFEVRRV